MKEISKTERIADSCEEEVLYGKKIYIYNFYIVLIFFLKCIWTKQTSKIISQKTTSNEKYKKNIKEKNWKIFFDFTCICVCIIINTVYSINSWQIKHIYKAFHVLVMAHVSFIVFSCIEFWNLFLGVWIFDDMIY